jgi:hypothetical protein
MPGIYAIEPGDEMDVEVVAAGVAADELRDDGDECSEKNDRGTGVVAQLRRARGACSLVPWFPWSLFFHGSKRNV